MMRKSSMERANGQHAYAYTVDSITCYGFHCIDGILGSVQGYKWLRSKRIKIYEMPEKKNQNKIH